MSGKGQPGAQQVGTGEVLSSERCLPCRQEGSGEPAQRWGWMDVDKGEVGVGWGVPGHRASMAATDAPVPSRGAAPVRWAWLEKGRRV